MSVSIETEIKLFQGKEEVVRIFFSHDLRFL